MAEVVVCLRRLGGRKGRAMGAGMEGDGGLEASGVLLRALGGFEREVGMTTRWFSDLSFTT